MREGVGIWGEKDAHIPLCSSLHELIPHRPNTLARSQDFYPETLAAAYIMHTSWLFRAVWAIVSPFLDEKTRSKVKVLAKYVQSLACMHGSCAFGRVMPMRVDVSTRTHHVMDMHIVWNAWMNAGRRTFWSTSTWRSCRPPCRRSSGTRRGEQRRRRREAAAAAAAATAAADLALCVW